MKAVFTDFVKCYLVDIVDGATSGIYGADILQ